MDSPFPGYIQQARTGELQVRMDPAGFVDIDKACQELITALSAARSAALELSARQQWGLGENHPRLSSAADLVRLFRDKAHGGPNNAVDVLAEYISLAEETQSMFTAIRDAYVHTDQDFATALRGISR